VLGDFVIGSTINDVMNIVSRLNGCIYLLLGNHDSMFNDSHTNIQTNRFIIKHGIVNINLFNRYTIDMFHYPLLE
jgi:calcineurin-like phosphoesterase family protein